MAARVVLPCELHGQWSGSPAWGSEQTGRASLTSLAETTSEPGLRGAQALGGDSRGGDPSRVSGEAGELKGEPSQGVGVGGRKQNSPGLSGDISPKSRMAWGGGCAEVSMLRPGAREAQGSKLGAGDPS